MQMQKWPRHYAADIMQLDPEARAEALAAVPEKFRDLVAKHVEITTERQLMVSGKRHTPPIIKRTTPKRRQGKQSLI